MARFVYFYREEVAVNIDAVVKVVFGEVGTAIHTIDGNYILLHDEGEAESFKQHLMENVYHDTPQWRCAVPDNREAICLTVPRPWSLETERKPYPGPWDDEDPTRHQETREEAARREAPPEGVKRVVTPEEEEILARHAARREAGAKLARDGAPPITFPI